MPLISLCLFTYNEKNNIRRCLNSVCELVDEIIVVDTRQAEALCPELGLAIQIDKYIELINGIHRLLF